MNKREVEASVIFTDQDGTQRRHSVELEVPSGGTPEGEGRVAHHIFSELRVAVRDQREPKHSSDADQLMEFPETSRSFDLGQYFDTRNSQAVWLELSNLVRQIEYHLEMARAFKELEPTEEPKSGDDDALDKLFFLHDRKMGALDRAVYELIKVQDLVNRLLHESLGGNLVDTSKTDWERTQLIRANVEKGLAAKLSSGVLSQADFDAINAALQVPRDTPQGDFALVYRRRLMHHIKPSVDYSIFFSALESREGEAIKDASGKVVGRRYPLLARPPVQYRFVDLHSSLCSYLDAVVTMLLRLSKIRILHQ